MARENPYVVSIELKKQFGKALSDHGSRYLGFTSKIQFIGLQELSNSYLES